MARGFSFAKAVLEWPHMFDSHPIKEVLRRWSAELPGSRWFVVGGAVRDEMLGRPLQDIDVLVANASFDDVMKFLEERGSVDAVGRTFGVLKFVSKENGTALDIALPRRERAAGTGGYRDVETDSDPSMPVEEDLGRRDFTINALAWEASTDLVIDPHGGRADLEKRVLRAVGDAETRFTEDYTRVLRLLRFAAQLNFEVEWETWRAAILVMPRLNDVREGQRLVPFELVARELLRGFAVDPVRTAALWQEAGATAELMPELAEWPEHVREALDRATQEDVQRIVGAGVLPARVLFALSIAYLGAENASALAERLRLSSAGFGIDGSLVRSIAAGSDVALYKALGMKPLLEGETVMKLLGLAPGPEVGQALDLLIDAEAKGKLTDPSQAGDWLKAHFDA
jgi:tRNA nucleotidyltransferase/poly(A) polymerase